MAPRKKTAAAPQADAPDASAPDANTQAPDSSADASGDAAAATDAAAQDAGPDGGDGTDPAADPVAEPEPTPEPEAKAAPDADEFTPAPAHFEAINDTLAMKWAEFAAYARTVDAQLDGVLGQAVALAKA